jgi:hypothetical protein
MRKRENALVHSEGLDQDSLSLAAWQPAMAQHGDRFTVSPSRRSQK